MKYFFVFATVAMITELVSFFPISIATIVKEINSFNIPIPRCLWLPNLTKILNYLDWRLPIKLLKPLIT